MNEVIIKGIGAVIQDLSASSTDSIKLIAPFISPKTLSHLFQALKHDNVVIVTSWRTDHLLSGISSTEIYPLCKDRRWTLKINNRIHAKAYIFDDTNLVIGSCNCTNAGLYDNPGSNIEAAVMIENISANNLDSLSKIIESSTTVTDEIYEKCVDWLSEQPKSEPIRITRPLILDPKKTTVLSIECTPTEVWDAISGTVDANDSVSTMMDEFGLFGIDWEYNIFEDHMKRCLENDELLSAFIQYVKETDDGNGIRFGTCRRWLENYIDRRYDRDYYNKLLNSLYDWAPIVDKHVETKQPRHTEVIRYLDTIPDTHSESEAD